MTYNEVKDYYVCNNNKKPQFEKVVYRKNKSGLKRIYVSERFESLRKESEENITTKEGITERLNRSIQAEGIFSYIKSGMNYLRFRLSSMKKIVA